MMGGDFLDSDLLKALMFEEVLDAHEDPDTGTPFDYDTGVIDVHNCYVVLLSIQGRGTGTENPINIRVNAVDSADYQWSYIDGGAVGSTTGATEWRDNIFDQNSALMGWIIKGGNLLSPSPNIDAPTIQSIGGGHYGKEHLLIGDLPVDVDDVNRIRVWTGFNAAGRLSINGYDFP